MKTLSGWSRFVRGIVFPCGSLAVVSGLRLLQFAWQSGESAGGGSRGFLAASIAALTISFCINMVVVLFQFEDAKKLTMVTAITPAALAAFLLIASW